MKSVRNVIPTYSTKTQRNVDYASWINVIVSKLFRFYNQRYFALQIYIQLLGEEFCKYWGYSLICLALITITAFSSSALYVVLPMVIESTNNPIYTYGKKEQNLFILLILFFLRYLCYFQYIFQLFWCYIKTSRSL